MIFLIYFVLIQRLHVLFTNDSYFVLCQWFLLSHQWFYICYQWFSIDSYQWFPYLLQPMILLFLTTILMVNTPTIYTAHRYNDFMFINNDLFTFSTNDISTYQYQRLLDNVPMIFMQSYQRLLLHKYPMIHYFQPTIFTLTSPMIFGAMIIQRFIINQPMIYTCSHQRFFVHYWPTVSSLQPTIFSFLLPTILLPMICNMVPTMSCTLLPTIHPHQWF